MLYNFQGKKLYRHLLVGGALCVAGLGMYSCSDTYDLDTKQPSGLNSIYGYMEERGNFTNYLRLIDDLGLSETFAKTGSLTMFVADDAAFARFFQSNKWGVKSYDDLSIVQKNLLLNSAMINNPYSTSMLASTASGSNSIRGEVCRRASSVSLMDSVLVIPPGDPNGVLPLNSRFDALRAKTDTILLFADASYSPPMIHFTPSFITANKLESSDIDFLYNQPAGTRVSDDVYINNAKVVDANRFCNNGFVHEVDEVILPLDNMAEVIRQKKQASIFGNIIERFAAPADSMSLASDYNEARKSKYKEDAHYANDQVFVKRYFSQRSTGSSENSPRPFVTDISGRPFDASLKFDPGWNAYNSGIKGKGDDPMMEDMAVMLVPSDAAMDEWWNNGSGKVIKDYYGSLEDTPNSVLEDLINVNQLSSLVASLPSAFSEVKNDAQEPLGIEITDVDSVFLACNGVVYLTNKVFAPASYSSVLFPAIVDTTNFRVINNAIDNLDYSTYLNSMVSRYIFLLPTNNGLLSYVDPVSYGQNTLHVWEFHIDPTQTSKAKQLYADVYQCQLNDDGTWTKMGNALPTSSYTKAQDITNKDGVMYDRLQDMLDNIIVTEPYQPGKKYYKTKGNTFVRIDGIEEGSGVYGTWQLERSQPLTVAETYKMDNGNALVLDGVVMGTRKSVAMTLSEHEEFSEFLGILTACGAVNKSNSKDGWQAGDQVFGNLYNQKEQGAVGAEDATSKQKATYLLNNYHYTVYAPTNDAMKIAYDMGLPSLEDLDLAESWDDWFKEQTEDMSDSERKAYAAQQGVCMGDSAVRIMEVMLDFVKYHIQDNSIYIDNGFESNAYESAKTELIPSTQADDNGNIWETGKYSPGRPYKLIVNVSNTGLTVTDVQGHTRNVITSGGLYNMMAREYWYDSKNVITNPYSVTLNNSSSVVVHAIDGPLVYDAPAQFKYKYKPITTVSTTAKRR